MRARILGSLLEGGREGRRVGGRVEIEEWIE
jgi:hypothetical protein